MVKIVNSSKFSFGKFGRIRNFLVILVSGIIFITAFLFLKDFLVKAEEQIEIFPVVYTGNWQNPEAAFFKDLGEIATFEEFNQENSAYPIDFSRIQIEEIATSSAEELPEIPPATSTLATSTPENSTPATSTPATSTPATSSSEILLSLGDFEESTSSTSSEQVTSTSSEQVATSTEEQIATTSEEISEIAGTSTEATPTFEEGLSSKPLEEMVTTGEEKITPVSKFLEFSGFFVAEEFKETEIKNIQLRISLAGKGNPGDKLIIEYFYPAFAEASAFALRASADESAGKPAFAEASADESAGKQDSWQTLTEFNLENEISNSLNGGYFLYTLPVFENWQDLENLKIKFVYQSQNIGQNSKVYLDSLWLEVEIGEKEIPAKILKRKDFRSNEDPEFLIPKKIGQENWLLGKLKSFFLPEFKINQAILVTPDGRETIATLFIEELGEYYHLQIKPDQNFKPGKYLLKLEIERSGKIQNLKQDFTWGVLAININKSIFVNSGDEVAYLQMAALRDDGHTICDANLKLEITNPKGLLGYTEIQRSGECGPNNVTSKPDYFAYYQVGGAGTYQMKLTNLDNGYEIEDFFEVRESVPFEVERIGPTRIYPPAIYEMTLRIKANQDFVGEVIESVPDSFEIESQILDSRFHILDSKRIVWQVDWKAGESYELKYQFDAPDVSPYLYMLGPLEFYE